MSNHILQNSDNYLDTYSHNTHEIFVKYTAIINEFILQYSENIKIKKLEYYNYVFNKGVETLCHVFKTILLYTKNLNITHIQCQKAVYYYIEFICQIGDSSHSFLQLNSKDATLFVYKKTIFEINNEIIKEFTSIVGSCSILTNIGLLTAIYNKTITSIVHKCCIDNIEISELKNELLKTLSYYTTELLQNLLNLHLDCTDKIYEDKLIIASTFNDFLLSTEQHISANFLIEFTKQLKKITIDNGILIKKLKSTNNMIFFQEYECKKYISWLINSNY